MSTSFTNAVEPLIRRQIFASEEIAAQELVREYVLRQIATLQREIARFERKYGMHFERFCEYLRERSVLLEASTLEPSQRRALGQAVMREEDDWLDWKAAQEMLDSWLGVRREAAL